jgi:hypothetical protein
MRTGIVTSYIAGYIKSYDIIFSLQCAELASGSDLTINCRWFILKSQFLQLIRLGIIIIVDYKITEKSFKSITDYSVQSTLYFSLLFTPTALTFLLFMFSSKST